MITLHFELGPLDGTSTSYGDNNPNLSPPAQLDQVVRDNGELPPVGKMAADWRQLWTYVRYQETTGGTGYYRGHLGVERGPLCPTCSGSGVAPR